MPETRARDLQEVTTDGHWFGPSERPLLGWLSTPGGRLTRSGVLVLPPIGYPYWSSHLTLRTLAVRLARDEHTVLRLDYDGTGDSAGDQLEPGRFSAWRASVAAGAAELRALGCRRLSVVGAQLGGTIGLLDGASIDAQAVAAWAPVTTGRQFRRQIRLLADQVPDDVDGVEAGTLVWAGAAFSPETLDEIGQVGQTPIADTPTRSLIVGNSLEVAAGRAMPGIGPSVEVEIVPGGDRALQRPTEEATVPEPIVETIRSWFGPADSRSSAKAEPRLDARLTWSGIELEERIVRLGTNQIVGIVTETAGATVGSGTQTLVLLNSGSESHIGPGRAWVEYARRVAADGFRAVRVDMRGFGESPDAGHAPARPYDEHVLDDIRTIVRALHEQGHERIVLLGLCATAWAALRLARSEPINGVIALNAQLYWEPGDPVEALMSTTHARRSGERRRAAWGKRLGLWTAADLLGRRPWASRWLDELVGAKVPVSLVFAEGDDGLEFLRTRVGRRFNSATTSGVVNCVEVPEIDHSMHRMWLRDRMVETIEQELLRM